MKRGLVLRKPKKGWAPKTFLDLEPGSHAAIFGSWDVSLDARRAGFEVRDCLLVLSPKGSERVWLLRKPLEKSTVIHQVLATGTGALWIDGSRVGYISEADKRLETRGVHEGGAYKHAAGTSFKKEVNKVAETHSLGRWPTNLLLVHGKGCTRGGVKRVTRSSNVAKDEPITATRRTGVHADAGGHQAIGRVQPVFGYGDSDGFETVADWRCEAGCPVPEMDRQSGTLATHGGSITLEMEGLGYGGGAGSAREILPDSGGASRFFPQFTSEAEVLAWLDRLLLGPKVDDSGDS